MKVKASEIKNNDFISGTVEEIRRVGQTPFTFKGLVQSVSPYSNEAFHDTVQVLLDTGIALWFKKEAELISEVISPEERARLQHRAKIKTLRRVVDAQGSDPELFIEDKFGQLIPAFDFLPDQKEAAQYNKDFSSNMFEDGYQAEFNIPGTSCLDSTMYYLQAGLSGVLKRAREHNPNAKLSIKPTFDIPKARLESDDDSVVQFGCMPSKNVYGMQGKKGDGRDVPFRSAGGHIHLQLNSGQKRRIPEYVKALDAILGVSCVSLFGSFDDVRRREYYGLAGEYRTPSHGLEYRTLSNVWLCHPTIAYIVFELARKVISLVDAGLYKDWQATEEETISAINDCNIPLANEIMERNEEMFKDIIASFAYKKEDNVNVIYATFMLGLEELIKNPMDIEKNWNIGEGFDLGTKQIRGMSKHNPNFKRLSEMKF